MRRSKYPDTLERWALTRTQAGDVRPGPAIADPEDQTLAFSLACKRIIRREGHYVMVDLSISLDRWCWTDKDELTILWPEEE